MWHVIFSVKIGFTTYYYCGITKCLIQVGMGNRRYAVGGIQLIKAHAANMLYTNLTHMFLHLPRTFSSHSMYVCMRISMMILKKLKTAVRSSNSSKLIVCKSCVIARTK